MSRTRTTQHRFGAITRLVLADVDNLVGNADAPEVDHVRLWRAIRDHAVRFDKHTRTIAAATSHSAFPAFYAMETVGVPAQRLVRNGVNGADYALLESVDIDRLIRSGLQEVVLASGDGIFTELALALRARGVRVILLVGRGTPAQRLLAACPTKVRLRWRAESSRYAIAS